MIDLHCHQGAAASAVAQQQQQSQLTTQLQQANKLRPQKRPASRCSSPSSGASSSSSSAATASTTTTTTSTTISTTTGDRSPAASPLGPNLHQMHQRRSMSPPPLARHISLINQTGVAVAGATTTTPTPATKRPASPSGDRNDLERLQMHQQQQQQRRAVSPGYNSAAPSPNSSVASPVSSGVSSASGSFCSSSSLANSPAYQQHGRTLTPVSVANCSPVAQAATSKSPPTTTTTTPAAAAAFAVATSRAANLISPSVQFATATSGGVPTACLAPISSSSGSLTRPAGALDPPHLLDYYPTANQDGAQLSWFHEANSRQSLGLALVSDKLVVGGDISLAEMSRYPVPIMARPPLTVSDLTLESWLQTVSRTQKGIKLNFTSTRTVEPAFRVLARHARNLQGPLILSADILTRAGDSDAHQPQTGKGRQQQAAANCLQPAASSRQPVDAWTFLMLCRTRFPRSIISIGWCSLESPASGLYKSVDTIQQQQPDRISVGGGQLRAQAAPLANLQQQPAEHHFHNNSSPGSESMFELDLVMEHPALVDGALSQHIQLLAAASRQFRQHQQQTPGAFHESAAGRQRLAADSDPASLAAQFGRHQQQHQHRLHSHHHQHQHHHHQLLSSNGSLNSSSGNSSGSPSPTSPIGHLASVSPAQHQQLLNHRLQQQQQQQRQSPPDSTEQLILAPAAKQQHWSALATAMASVASGHPLPGHPLDFQRAKAAAAHLQQLPLNLNINEADPQHNSAQRARPGHSSAGSQHHLQHQQQPLDQVESLAAAVLANRLFNPSVAAPPQPNGAQPNNWPQADRKGATLNLLTAAAAGSLLCVRSPSRPGHQPARPTNHHHQDSDSMGYTREMIDKMASLVKEYNLTQPVTFPVEARLLGKSNSLVELQRLLHQVGLNSTLTIVAQKEDLVKVDDLLAIRKHFASNQILYDLPDELAAELRHELQLAP